jgi:hypothetical protein|tara:strand:- start:2211 stop:2396 length:186 start_codon:yes stop_codon:yes gene_type:complete
MSKPKEDFTSLYAGLELARRQVEHLFTADPKVLSTPQLKMITAISDLMAALQEQYALEKTA